MRMPAEWEEHEKTWMAFPCWPYEAEDGSEIPLEPAQLAWARVANEISEFEQVAMLVHPKEINLARKFLSSAIQQIPVELDDFWLRDSGPTFVFDEGSTLVAVDWIFNGWGQVEGLEWDADALLGKFVGELAGSAIRASRMVNEGGGIHVDGQGRIMLTETVQLGRGRNESWKKSEVEAELSSQLGVGEFVWFKRGLYRDYKRFGTRGHVDMIACFTPSGTVLFHDQQDASHPDYEVSSEISEALIEAGIATLQLPAPKILKDTRDFVDYSYINHYVCNGAVIMGTFDDPNDDQAAEILSQCYPGREVVRIPAQEIFLRGGGIHCITQQQPAAQRKTRAS